MSERGLPLTSCHACAERAVRLAARLRHEGLAAPAPAGDSGDPCPKHRARGVNPECGDCDQPAPAGDSGGERRG